MPAPRRSPARRTRFGPARAAPSTRARTRTAARRPRGGSRGPPRVEEVGPLRALVRVGARGLQLPPAPNQDHFPDPPAVRRAPGHPRGQARPEPAVLVEADVLHVLAPAVVAVVAHNVAADVGPPGRRAAVGEGHARAQPEALPPRVGGED